MPGYVSLLQQRQYSLVSGFGGVDIEYILNQKMEFGAAAVDFSYCMVVYRNLKFGFHQRYGTPNQNST